MKQRTKRITMIIFGIILLLLVWAWVWRAPKPAQMHYGVTFSQQFASAELGLDWKATYLAMLDDLKVDHVRLVAHWPSLESTEGTFTWDDLDWQINEASKRNVDIVLAIGYRVPRWPECHIPQWAKTKEQTEWRRDVLDLLRATVDRYKSTKTLSAWQVENEPLFAWFGECPKPDKEFLKQEVALVKELDPARPVIITDTGEISSWLPAAGVGDRLGVTMYRVVWNKYIGYFRHVFPPSFYGWRKWYVEKVMKKPVFVAEMQAEPWSNQPLPGVPTEKQNEIFNLDDLKAIIRLSEGAGFDTVYFWGVEWWYWSKLQGNDHGIWDYAKTLWADEN